MGDAWPVVDETAQRLEILDAMIAAIDRRDEIFEIIDGADDADAACLGIAQVLAVTEVGAHAILSLQLRRLSRREVQRIRDEREHLRALSDGGPG
jgi:DNA gyrase/topoisomerase IV subunit A